MNPRVSEFFKKLDIFAATFDDVDLTKSGVSVKTGYTEVTADNVSLKTWISKNVASNIPFMSAPMDTVTEYELAIALAEEGGFPVIHRNLSIEDQAWHVARTKHSIYGGFIPKPVCVQERDTIGDVLKRKEEKGFKFYTFPVVQSAGQCVGLLTKKHFKYCKDLTKKVCEVMTKIEDSIFSRILLSFEEAYAIMEKHQVGVLPHIDGKNEIAGLWVYDDIDRVKSGSSISNVDSYGRLRVGAAIGTTDDEFERAAELIRKHVDLLVLDLAHGDSKFTYEMLRKIKSRFSVDVMIGNVSEPESAQRLCEAGADGLRVGQGGSMICTTRVVAGVGCPQLRAIYNCAAVAEKYEVPVCADGGVRYSGDVVKAIAAGAFSVMVGGLFAGTDEAPGEEIIYQGRRYKEYRGMGSVSAILESKGSRGRYLQEGIIDAKKIIPEGVEARVPCKGPLRDIVFQLIGGVRSGMANYIGAASIRELQEKADFYLVPEAGIKEAHPHDVVITRDAPNYPMEEDA